MKHATNVEPVVIADPVAGNTAFFAVAVSGTGDSPILRPVMLSPQADFVPRFVNLCRKPVLYALP